MYKLISSASLWLLFVLVKAIFYFLITSDMKTVWHQQPGSALPGIFQAWMDNRCHTVTMCLAPQGAENRVRKGNSQGTSLTPGPAPVGQEALPSVARGRDGGKVCSTTRFNPLGKKDNTEFVSSWQLVSGKAEWLGCQLSERGFLSAVPAGIVISLSGWSCTGAACRWAGFGQGFALFALCKHRPHTCWGTTPVVQLHSAICC